MKKQAKTSRAEILKQAQPKAKVSKAKHAGEENEDDDLPEEEDDYEKPDTDDEADDIDDSKAKFEDVPDFKDLDMDDDDEEYFNDDF